MDSEADIVYLEWAVSYYAPEEAAYRAPYGEVEDLERRRLYWEVNDWRPDEEVSKLWREVGRERYGGDGGEVSEHGVGRREEGFGRMMKDFVLAVTTAGWRRCR